MTTPSKDPTSEAPAPEAPDADVEEEQQRQLVQARAELAESRGRHRTQMARKSSAARAAKRTCESGEMPAVRRPFDP